MNSLSIVIVNYNSKFFLDLCLHSVDIALQGIDSEVIVVDNASVDNSQEFITSRYPWVRWIQSETNVGFSKGNNMAIPLCTKRYILLLNPDTIVPEDCFSKSLAFMEKHSTCGALGVRMVDGRGNYLPESKRGLPTPIVAFLKLSGLSNLCPRSKVCSKYYMGHLPENKISKVEVLSGAFMMVRKKAIQRIGLLDEGYFMYGEDIDLSYRILLGGYLNYYFPEVTIIHFKGESTNKNPKYVAVFYQAMKRFADKYFAHNKVFYYIFEPSLFVVSRIAYAKAHISTLIRSLFQRKIGLRSVRRANVFGSEANWQTELMHQYPKLSLLPFEDGSKRSVSTLINVGAVSVKSLISKLGTMKGKIFIVSPQKDYLIGVSSSKSVGKIFPIK